MDSAFPAPTRDVEAALAQLGAGLAQILRERDDIHRLLCVATHTEAVARIGELHGAEEVAKRARAIDLEPLLEESIRMAQANPDREGMLAAWRKARQP